MTGVVLDTNVLVSANLKPKGLEAYVVSLALNRHIGWFVSAPILAEYEEVLRRPELRFIPDEIECFLSLLRKTSRMIRPSRPVEACLHEADNRSVECAEAAMAAFLVTGNKRHFPAVWKTARIVNAREFIEYFAAEKKR